MTGGTNGGAGGLNLRIVGSNTQPPHPVDNTVWINTETRIPNWYWQADEPTNKETGTLWIRASSVATNNLSLLRHNTLVVGFGTARQWDGSAWQVMGGKIYYSGAWHNLQTFVYDGTIGNAENNFNHNVGGYPWQVSTGGGIVTSITPLADHFNCYYGYGNGGAGLCYSRTKIDFTNVSKVRIVYTGSVDGAGGDIHRMSVFQSPSSGTESGLVASATLGFPSSKSTAEINTANLSGEYYLGLRCNSVASGHSWTMSYNIYTIELVS